MESKTFRYSTSLSGQGCRVIRTLQLLPASSKSERLAIELQETLLDANPIYDAISYCWGGQAPSVAISCNGEIVWITENLAAILRVLRRKNECIVLWADAVCINQQDIGERNVQVGLMRDIYSRASTVHVWLGEDLENGDVEASFDLLQCLSNGWDRVPSNESSTAAIAGDARDGILKSLSLPGNISDSWHPLSRLFERPWFLRMWIVQEIALARNGVMHCGERELPWSTFTRGMLFSYRLDLTATLMFGLSPDMPWYRRGGMLANLSYLILTVRDYQASGRSMGLLKLLVRHRAVSSTDPRDKIFALLGLVPSESDETGSIQADYNLDCVTVYMQLATELLRRCANLELLSACGRYEEAGSGVESLPSWVPDWSLPQYNVLLASLLDPDSSLVLKAAGNSTSRGFVTINKGCLEIQGYIFDQITGLGGAFGADKMPHRTWNWALAILSGTSGMMNLPRWEKVSRCKKGVSYPNGEDSMAVFLRTIFDWDTTCTVDQLQQFFDFIKAWAWWARVLHFFQVHRLAGLYVIAMVVTQTLVSLARGKPEVMVRVSPAADASQLVRTKRSYIALAPPASRKGDLVVLARGGRVPLVLRPNNGKDSRQGLVLIGDAYIPGIMLGEAFEDEKCKSLKIY